jgi:hypothetical protein
VRPVAAELFDQAVFPVETDLHCGGVDVGTFIGPAVAKSRIGFRQVTLIAPSDSSISGEKGRIVFSRPA